MSAVSSPFFISVWNDSTGWLFPHGGRGGHWSKWSLLRCSTTIFFTLPYFPTDMAVESVKEELGEQAVSKSCHCQKGWQGDKRTLAGFYKSDSWSQKVISYHIWWFLYVAKCPVSMLFALWQPLSNFLLAGSSSPLILTKKSKSRIPEKFSLDTLVNFLHITIKKPNTCNILHHSNLRPWNLTKKT